LLHVDVSYESHASQGIGQGFERDGNLFGLYGRKSITSQP